MLVWLKRIRPYFRWAGDLMRLCRFLDATKEAGHKYEMYFYGITMGEVGVGFIVRRKLHEGDE